MKIHVIDKLSRTVSLILTYLLQLLWILIYVTAIIYGGSAEVWFTSTVMFLLTAALTVYVTLLCFAVVTIDEKGVTVRTGKLVFNSADWVQIDRIVLVEWIVKGSRRLGINFVLKNKQGKINPKRVMFNIFNKKVIGLAYNKQTYTAIKKYYSAWIENEHLIYDYYDDGVEKPR